MSRAVERIEAARERGVDVMASVYPYIASSTGLDQVLPDWVTEGGTDATLARLADPALRDSLEAELSGRTQSGDWTLGTSAGGPSGIQISDVVTDSLERYEGMRLDAIAAERGQSAAAAAIDPPDRRLAAHGRDLLLDERGRSRARIAAAVGHDRRGRR